MARLSGTLLGRNTNSTPLKSKSFPFVSEGCKFTDDTVMTIAVAKALMRSHQEEKPFKRVLIEEAQEIGKRFPKAGYGARFWYKWLQADDPQPYGSYGNGSAMRVSPCALVAVTLEEALELARASAEITHDHPEGIKGAQAVAAAVFMAKTGKNKDEIRDFIESNYYPLERSLDEIREGYSFDETCQGSVPEAIIAFLESEDYEDAVRNAVSLGGDADTQAAIAGSIAWSYYRLSENVGEIHTRRSEDAWPEWCERIVAGYGIRALLPADFVETIETFNASWPYRAWSFDRIGLCRGFNLSQ